MPRTMKLWGLGGQLLLLHCLRVRARTSRAHCIHGNGEVEDVRTGQLPASLVVWMDHSGV